MSYAAAAAKGPKQSAEEKRAPAPPEVLQTEPVSESSSSFAAIGSSGSVHTAPSDRAEEFKNSSIKEAEKLEHEARDAAAKVGEGFSAKSKEARAKAKKAARSMEANSDNPVFVGNAIAVVVLSAGLGFGAYKKYSAGELSWKVVGTWTGVIGLFAVGDYYLSRYLFKNKYPPKN